MIKSSLVLVCLLAATAVAQVPPGYKGTPFHDAQHPGGPQVIPGRLEVAYYDLGGEGVAYHDTDAVNHGSGELNYTQGHCEDGVAESICHFREHEGVDISYVKKLADLNHPSPFLPQWKQLYIGWEEDGEWVNYTVDVKKAGTYEIRVLYSHVPNTIDFSLNDQPAATCRLPSETGNLYPERHDPAWMVFHTWNRADCGQITFPKAGLQLLTLHYKKGNNLAYFDFIPGK